MLTVLVWLLGWFALSACVGAIWMAVTTPRPPRAPSDLQRRLMRGERT